MTPGLKSHHLTGIYQNIQNFKINELSLTLNSTRDIAGNYATKMRALTLKVLEAISESLGLERDYIAKALGKQNQTMQINYYPPCPNPDLTLALGAHTDPNCLTIVQHDEVSGLQIMKDGSWFDVPYLHGAFFVNIGDQLQVNVLYTLFHFLLPFLDMSQTIRK